MNSIWNDPDFVVRAGRVWETVVSFLIEMDSLLPKELAVSHVTHHCPHPPPGRLNLRDHFHHQLHVSLDIKVVKYWHLERCRYASYHENLRLLNNNIC